MKKAFLLFSFSFIISNLAFAQITNIPDPNFEQALIDLGIDSDGIINGQVFTADIENVISLDVQEKGIQDLTGIQDFMVLEYLNVDNNYISNLNVSSLANLKALFCFQNNLTTLDVSNNILLEEISCGNVDDIAPQNRFPYLNLSNNPHIWYVEVTNNEELVVINVNNGNNQEPMELYFAKENDDTPICIQVDDPDAANSNQYPYSEWIHDTFFYYYSDDCSLSLPENTIGFSLYPNPTDGLINIISNSNQIIESAIITDVNGRIIEEIRFGLNVENVVSFKNYSSGIYFIRLINDSNSLIKRVVKK